MIAIAGHLCLDIIPAIPAAPEPLGRRLLPGSLLNIGAATLSTGGAVANTGLALHRLGEPVRLIAKVGADPFAATLRTLLGDLGHHLLETAASPTSYSVVLNPPGGDRSFLHCPGANDTFTADELLAQNYDGVKLVHFGYPPLMRQMYVDDGRQLTQLFRGFRGRGLTTSLDMALPDPDSPAGKAPWQRILLATLPFVDVFTPSLDEILYMLNPVLGTDIRKKIAEGVPLGGLSSQDIRNVMRDLLNMGCAAVLLKLGDQGACACVARNAPRLPENWRAAECARPCFTPNPFAGATGAGDATIAGFLCGLTRNMSLADTLRLAVATGAASVEKPDATSGIPKLDDLLKRLTNWPVQTTHFTVRD